MSDSVLAAIITATATICMSLLQLRFSLGRDGGARVQTAGGRRKGRGPFAILFVIIISSGVGGFALSQWLNESERASQSMLQHELQDRVDQITRTANQLEQTRAGARAEIEAGVLRKIGSDGIVVMATVGPCRPSLVVSTGTATPPGVTAETAQPAAAVCTESEASAVTLCATIPGNATITEIELYTRFAQSDTPWSASRVMAGQESGQARFAQEHEEGPTEAPGTKQVCQGFTHWSTEHARVARMVVRYEI